MICYIAGPYCAPTERGVIENIRAAEGVAIELARAGIGFVCPHLNSALCVAPNGFWLEMTMQLLARCDAVVFLPTWERSAGARAERDRALAISMPIVDWDASAIPALRKLAEELEEDWRMEG